MRRRSGTDPLLSLVTKKLYPRQDIDADTRDRDSHASSFGPSKRQHVRWGVTEVGRGGGRVFHPLIDGAYSKISWRSDGDVRLSSVICFSSSLEYPLRASNCKLLSMSRPSTFAIARATLA